MKPRHMDYYETPAGKKLAHGVTHEMVRLNRALDTLRAVAYREGVTAPLYVDEVPSRASPWDTKQELLNVLSEGLARMDVLRQPRSRAYLGEALRNSVQLLYSDICDHGNRLERCGYLHAQDTPQAIAADKHILTSSMRDICAHYEAQELGPLPQVDVRGAAIISPVRATGKA